MSRVHYPTPNNQVYTQLDTPTTLIQPTHTWVTRVTAAIATGKHPDPSRTRKLSLPAPMVLPPRGGGRVGRRRTSFRERATSNGGPFVISACSRARSPSTAIVPVPCFHRPALRRRCLSVPADTVGRGGDGREDGQEDGPHDGQGVRGDRPGVGGGQRGAAGREVVPRPGAAGADQWRPDVDVPRGGAPVSRREDQAERGRARLRGLGWARASVGGVVDRRRRGGGGRSAAQTVLLERWRAGVAGGGRGDVRSVGEE